MWKHWYDEDAPESARVPDFEDRITDYFDKLLLVRSLREDRALLCVNECAHPSRSDRTPWDPTPPWRCRSGASMGLNPIRALGDSPPSRLTSSRVAAYPAVE